MAGLTKMCVQKTSKRCFIANKKGHIFIYDISPCPPQLLHTLNTRGKKGCIRAMAFNDRLNYLFTTNINTGTISIYDIGKPGQEKVKSRNIANYPAQKGSREIVWLTGRSEFAIGNSNGTIAYWNSKRGEPIFNQETHKGNVTKVQWFEEMGLIVSSGKDKSIKFYELPEFWRDKKLEE